MNFPTKIYYFILEIIDYIYFLFKVSTTFRNGIILAAGVLIYALSEVYIKTDIYYLLGAVIALIVFLTSFFKFQQFGSGSGDTQIFARPKKYININGKDINFSNFKPSQEEIKDGFSTIDPKYNSEEYAVSSESLNNWLTLEQPKIGVEIGPDQSFKYCHKENTDGSIGIERAKAQLKYLHYKVFSSNLTTNDNKFSLLSPIMKGTKKIKVAKVGYYDALITNEAFRSVLYHRQNGSEIQENTLHDLRKYYPYDLQGSSVHLKDLYPEYAAGHVGVSTLVISKDRYPVFFEQANWNDQMAGKMVVSGSGSVDYADIKNSNSSNLLDILKYSMAREFSQEGKQDKKGTKQLADNTLIIGYFRWIDRCGKPEFIGITLSNKTKEEIKADLLEVVSVRTSTSNRKIYTLDDLKKTASIIKKDIKDFNLEKEMKGERKRSSMGLSSAMVLYRLSQIASLDKGSPERIKVDEFISQGLTNS